MKKFLIAILLLVCQMSMFAQTEATKPTIIAFPSRLYMNKMHFGQEVTTNGRTRFMPDYDKAFLNDAYLKTALSGVSMALKERDFEVKMLESSLNDLDDQASFNMAGDVEVSLEDRLMESVRPDIKLEVEFYVSSNLGPRKGWTVKVDAVDAYTNEPVGSFSSIVDPSSDIPDLVLKKVMAGHIDEFGGQILNYFQDLHDKGRKVSVLFHTRASGGLNMEEDEINDEPIQDYLEDWIKARALNHNSRTIRATEHMMEFNVRIPFFDDGGLPLDTKTWARKLRTDLKGLGIKATLKTRGLGRIDVLLGDN